MLRPRASLIGPTGLTGATGATGATGSTGAAGPGTVTTDVVVNNSAKGLVLKDSATPAHYWRQGVSILGVPSWSDIGTSAP